MIFLLEVQSKEFSVKIDELTGATFSLSLREDPHHMNWVGGPGTFGVPCLIPQRIGNYDKRPNGYPPASPLPFVSAQKRDHDVVCVFEDKRVRVTVTKGFRETDVILNAIILKMCLPMKNFSAAAIWQLRRAFRICTILREWH